MRGFILIILLMSIKLFSIGQNLVPNPGFDTSALSPSTYAQICHPTGWSSPSGYCALVYGHGSPDYYKVGGTGGAGTPVTFWATVDPHSGAGMAGFGTYMPSPVNFREYIRTTLSSPLIPGTVYDVSFWITNGITWLNGHATNNIGIAFTTTLLSQPGTSNIAVIPQVEYTSVLWDTLWHQLSFTFTATDASQYMTIGNFRTDAATTITNMKTVCCPTSSAAYYYIDDIIVQPATPLPIELLNFSGAQTNNGVDLKWETANELNSDHFEIQRSEDAVMFEFLSSVKATGNSETEIQYQYLDDAPISGNNFYRLKQVDIDGSYKFSNTIVVEVDRSMDLQIFPNPTTDKLFITTNIKGQYYIEILSATGKEVYKSYPENNLSNTFNLNIKELQQGIYIVKLISGNTILTDQFVKIH